MQLTPNIETSTILAPVSNASDTASYTDVVDMQGFEGVRFITPITDIANTGVALMTIKQNSTSGTTGASALTGATATVTSTANDDVNDTLLIVDVYKPLGRYLYGYLTTTIANVAFGETIIEKYGPKSAPVDTDDTVSQATCVVSPAEA